MRLTPARFVGFDQLDVSPDDVRRVELADGDALHQESMIATSSGAAVLRSNQSPGSLAMRSLKPVGMAGLERHVDAERRQLIAHARRQCLQGVLVMRHRPRTDTGANAGDRRHDQDAAGALALHRRATRW